MPKYFKIFIPAVLFIVLFIFLYYTNIIYATSTHSVNFDSNFLQYLSAPDSSPLSITGDMTIELWIKPASLPLSGNAVFLISKNDIIDGLRSYQLKIMNDAGDMQLRFEVSEGGTGATETTAQLSHTPTIDMWAHYAVVYTSGASPQAEFFKNGISLGVVPFNTPSNANSIHDNGSMLRIGAIGSVPSGFFNGNIDDVRIWSVKRTSVEIAGNKDKELSGGEVGLAAYWKLNNSLNDSTINVNNLVNNNSAAFSMDVPTIGQSITKIRKAFSQATTTSIVLYADNELSTKLEANKIYKIEGSLFIESSSAIPDFKFAFESPTGSDLSIGYIVANGSAGGSEGRAIEGIATSDPIRLAAGVPTVVKIDGIIVTNNTGPLTLKWAQVTSSNIATFLKKNSFLIVEEF